MDDPLVRVERLLEGYEELGRRLNNGLDKVQALSDLLPVEQPISESPEVCDVAEALRQDFGTQDDDKLATNETLDAFLEELGDHNYYTAVALTVLDPDMYFARFRSNAKMILLPCFQILVPFGMIWYRLVTHSMLTENGYCSQHGGIIFRGVGFITFMYSAWQIMDGCGDASSQALLMKAVKHWSQTGLKKSWNECVMFYMCYLSQTLCSFMLLLVTYTLYTVQSETPLDLLMNCVAVNFVLDIDVEWMDSTNIKNSNISAASLFRGWRDAVTLHEPKVARSVKKSRSLRRHAPQIIARVLKYGDLTVVVLGYTLVFGWTFCPPGY